MSSDLSIRRAGASRICATIALAGGVGHSARAAERPAEGRPYAVECDYRASWGHDDEFIWLCRKNHLPVLKKLMEEGRILKLSAVQPRYHAAEEGRWDYRVTIIFKDAVVAHDTAFDEGVRKELFPDQEAFKKDEPRRFEILQAHWDVPVEDVALEE